MLMCSRKLNRTKKAWIRRLDACSVHDLETSTGLLRVECAFYWVLTTGLRTPAAFFSGETKFKLAVTKLTPFQREVMHFGGNRDNMATANKEKLV